MSELNPKESTKEPIKCIEVESKEVAKSVDPENATSDEMDAGSENFSPFRALYTNDYRISKKNPPTQYQNLAAYETALNKYGIWGMQQKIPKPGSEAPSSSKAVSKLQKTKITVENTERRFLPHQLPIKAPTNFRERHLKNIWKSIEKFQGPLSMLLDCMRNQHKVRVVLRNEHGVRGHVEGKVICFDKHWNLLLNEVIEVWRRRKFKYGVNKNCGLRKEAQDCTQQLANLGISLPQQSVKSLNRKNVEITRQLQQLLVRGEQIVLVNILKT